MYTFQPVSDRMMRLRKIYRETYPQVSVERVRIVTDFYQQHPDEPILLKRAKLLMEVVRQSTLRVEEDELIVGNIAPTYRGATLLPELGIDWLYDELRDGSFESRGDTEEGYYIAPEDKAYLFTTEAYWRKHSVSAGMACAAPDGLKSTYGSGVISYGGVNMCTTPVGHFNTNYDKVLYKGFGKVRDEARAKMDELEGRIFGNDAEKYVFYKSVTIVCDAAIHLAVRYAALCRKKANEASGDRRKELIQMASSLEWILENPCRTYWEAAQALFLYQIIMTLDAANHALSIGRLDQYLWPYLEADLEKNRITISAAQEIMDCLFLKIADINKIWPLAG
ncbi:MAG: hypothetical protein LBN36_04995, partial [Clostridiales Family XIII bacterium]|nr:hypothetical protein [Clostridiales Family XIII bacterium]